MIKVKVARSFCVFAIGSLVLCLSAGFLRADEQKPAEPKLDGKVLGADLNKFLTRLSVNPWARLPAGTQVVRSFEANTPGHGGVKHYLQPDLTYEVIAKGKTFVRKQLVNGKETTQTFSISNEVGIPKPMTGGQAKPVNINIDGVSLACHRKRFVLLVRTATGVIDQTTTEWTLKKYPAVLIKRLHHNGNYWQVQGFSVRTINGRKYRCVEFHQHMATATGFVLTIGQLSPDVPGHVVEEIKKFYSQKPTAKKPTLEMISREYVKSFVMTKDSTQQDASTEADKPRR